jgi:general secretion pathway protein G
MNKKAFTLVELLAIITIMGLLAVIAVVGVTDYINKSYNVSYNTLVDSIESATELYVADHSGDFPQLDVPGSVFTITLNDLVESNYIKSKLIDERTGEQIPLTEQVDITVVSTTKISVSFVYP